MVPYPSSSVHNGFPLWTLDFSMLLFFGAVKEPACLTAPQKCRSGFRPFEAIMVGFALHFFKKFGRFWDSRRGVFQNSVRVLEHPLQLCNDLVYEKKPLTVPFGRKVLWSAGRPSAHRVSERQNRVFPCRAMPALLGKTYLPSGNGPAPVRLLPANPCPEEPGKHWWEASDTRRPPKQYRPAGADNGRLHASPAPAS